MQRSLMKITTTRSNAQKFVKMCKNLFLVLIDKDHQPKWNPGTLQDVTAEKVDSYFESLGENELQF
jgi:hypothetical protein